MTEIQVTTKEQANIEVLTLEIVQEWLAYERSNNDASANTITAYEKGLAIWQQWLTDNGITGLIAPSVVRQFKSELSEKYSSQTVNLRLSAIRSFYRFLVTTDRLPFNPASEVKGSKRKKSTVHKRDSLTSEEVKCLLASCDVSTSEGARDKAIITLMVYCGLREVEIHRANYEDLRTQNDRLVLYVQGKGHTEKDTYVVIPVSQEGVIRNWIKYYHSMKLDKTGNPLFVSFSNRSNSERLSLRGIQAIVKGLFCECGIVGDKKSTHSLRHTAITNAIRNGASPMQVQAMARHTSFDTTLNYIHEVNRLDNPAEDFIKY